MLNPKDNFLFKGNDEFNDRQKSVFGMLDKLAPENMKNRYTEDEFQNSKSKLSVNTLKKDVKHFRGKESIFKKPDIPRKRSFKMTLPDYVKNPHKWKKYELGDYVMTDKSNWEVALKFHKELQERKEPMQVEDVVSEPIKYNRHIFEEGSDLVVKEGAKPEYKDGKVIMPEYVVGEKLKKIVQKKKKTSTAEEVKANVKLGHLLYEDEN